MSYKLAFFLYYYTVVINIPSEIYFSSVLDCVVGRTHQLHLNIPSKNSDGNFSDGHQMFNLNGDFLEDKILDLTRQVIENSPKLEV